MQRLELFTTGIWNTEVTQQLLLFTQQKKLFFYNTMTCTVAHTHTAPLWPHCNLHAGCTIRKAEEDLRTEVGPGPCFAIYKSLTEYKVISYFSLISVLYHFKFWVQIMLVHVLVLHHVNILRWNNRGIRLRFKAGHGCVNSGLSELMIQFRNQTLAAALSGWSCRCWSVWLDREQKLPKQSDTARSAAHTQGNTQSEPEGNSHRSTYHLPLQTGVELLPQGEGVSGSLFTKDGEMDHEMDGWFGSAYVKQSQAEPEDKAFDFAVNLRSRPHYQHWLWVVTGRMRSGIQAAEISFFMRVDTVMSRDIQRDHRVHLLLLCPWIHLMWCGYLHRMPPGHGILEVFCASPIRKRHWMY